MNRTVIALSLAGLIAISIRVDLVFAIAPNDPAGSVKFSDEDSDKDELGGTITIQPAEDETAITDYVIYWGADKDTKTMPAITTLMKAGGGINIFGA